MEANSKEFDRIHERSQIRSIFTDAMNKLQQGDRKTLKMMLNFIHNEYKSGFTVHKGLPEGDAIVTENDIYTHEDKTVIVRDEDVILMGFYKCRIDGQMKMHFREELLMTGAERDFIFKEQIKMSKASSSLKN